MKRCWLHSFSLFFLLGTMFLFSACQSHQTSGLISTSKSPVAHIAPQVDCPAAEQARALDIIPLTHGTHAAIVYDDQEIGSSTINSYDVVTGKKSIIYTAPANKAVTDEHLSGDGQWVLFESGNINGPGSAVGNPKLQAIRIDGQDLQTLYCTDSSHELDHIQWSPDQTYIAFTTAPNSKSDTQPGKLYLLNTINGDLQTEMMFSVTNYSYPVIWLDATHLYVTTAQGIGAPPPIRLYLLDITQGTNHMQTVWNSPDNYASWYASLSPNRERLYISQMHNIGQATIYALSPTGAGAQAIYHNQVQDEVDGLCAATNDTLLVSVWSPDRTPSNNNGLYKMNTNGTGLTKVFPLQASNDSIDVGCTTLSENVSRDGSLYAFRDSNAQNNALYYGKLNGGQPTMFASTGSITETAHIIGWTML